MTKTEKLPGCGKAALSVRITGDNPDHHIWWNRGTWWFHATVHLPDLTKRRFRSGLGTKDITVARARRDEILSGARREAWR